jgi:hypothetical protein
MMTGHGERTGIKRIIRERIAEIKILLMFGPFLAPYTHHSDRLAWELAFLQSLLARGRRAKR